MSNLNRHMRTGLLLLILIIALTARLLLIHRLEGRTVYSDEEKNLLLAAHLTAGAGYTLADGKATAVIPAGYPLWLAALRQAGITTPWQIRLIQAGLSVATVLLLYLFSRMLFGATAALLAAAAAALYPYFIFLPGTILATTWYSMLLVLGTWLYVKAVSTNKYIMMFFVGIVWGWAVLSVTTAIVLAGATVVWHLRHARSSGRQMIRLLASFAAGLLLILLPWLLRNQQHFGRWTLATNGGYNLWLGNNAASDMDEPCRVPTPAAMDERIIASGSEIFADSLFSATALDFIRREPARFVARTLLKALLFWRLDPSPVTASYFSASGWAAAVSLLTVAPLLLLALWGVGKAPPPLRQRLMLFIYFAAVYTAVHAVMIVKVRLRLPLDHFVIMLAAYGAVELWNRHQMRRGE